MKKFLEKVEHYTITNPANISWNSIPTPFELFPSIYDESAWDVQPEIKYRRYTMWKTLAAKLTELDVRTLLDVGTSSGQFVLCCLLAGVKKVYGLDPREVYLYSNEADFQKAEYNAREHLSIGCVESLTKALVEFPKFKTDCITLLNFFHGDDWMGRDLEFLKAINGKTTYLVISDPRSEEARAYLYENYEVVYVYQGFQGTYENHTIFKIKTK